MRASPSGKASASQADTRGFESRCPLQKIKARRCFGAVLFSINCRDSNPPGCERKANAKRLQRAGEGAGRRLKPVRICEANTRTSRCPLHRARGASGTSGPTRCAHACARTGACPLKPVRICEANTRTFPWPLLRQNVRLIPAAHTCTCARYNG